MNNIYIKDEKELNEKIQQIKQDGKENLHIISDFDNTLSKAYVNGIKTQSMISQVCRLGYLGQDYMKKHDEMYAKYNPIETDPNLSLDYKCEKMNEWWSVHIKILSSYGLNRKILDEVIAKSHQIVLRDDAKYFLDLMHENNIPVLIFSSGTKYFIEGYLKRYNIDYKNISIISNEYDFDSEGYVKGYKNKIIHVFNKNEFALKDDLHYYKILNRKNIILLGDSLGDLTMADGLEHKTKITIGFYNAPEQKHLDEYKKAYDIVITNDSDMSYVNELLKKILS